MNTTKDSNKKEKTYRKQIEKGREYWAIIQNNILSMN
jgi:hypothetical protein